MNLNVESKRTPLKVLPSVLIETTTMSAVASSTMTGNRVPFRNVTITKPDVKKAEDYTKRKKEGDSLQLSITWRHRQL